MPDEEIRNVPITFANQGTILKSAPDEIPIQTYKALLNVSTTRENSVTVRRGFTRLNEGLPAPPHSSYYLKDFQGYAWRYAISNAQLYVAPVTDPANAAIWPTASGTDFGAVSGANNLSWEYDPRAIFATRGLYGTEIKPYIFFADGEVFLKHAGGQAAARRVGIPKPTNMIDDITIADLDDIIIQNCDDHEEWEGGDPSAVRAEYSPSVFWEPAGLDNGARIIYARYSWTYTDLTESGPSLMDFRYIPDGSRARVWWHKNPDEFPVYGTTLYGSGYGDPFEDIPPIIPNDARISSIKINHSNYVNSLQITYQCSDGTVVDGPKHGGFGDGSGGNILSEFTLDFDEHITEVIGYTNGSVNQIAFVTNKRQSDWYGGYEGTLFPEPNFSITLPEGDPEWMDSVAFIGFHGVADDYLGKIGMTYVNYGPGFPFDSDPAGVLGWNLYLGTNPEVLYKVNDDYMELDEYYTEPSTGYVQGTKVAFFNTGEVTDDPSGQVDSAIKLSTNGASAQGRASAALYDESGYSVLDLGQLTEDDNIKFYVKFEDQDSLDNCYSIEIRFWLSDIPGDVGDSEYQYYAMSTLTDFSGFSAATWEEVTLTKGSFIFVNNGDQLWPNLGWDTVSGISLTVTVKDPAVGAEDCNVSFDHIVYEEVGKLYGTDLQWTFTYYNTKTNTESDYANPSIYGAEIDGQGVQLYLPQCPTTEAPNANPDKIRIYRMGGTIEQFQLVTMIDYTPGFAPAWVKDNIPDSLLGAVMDTDNQLPPDHPKGVVAYDNRLWTWGGSYTNDDLEVIQEPPNRLRFSKNVDVEEFPAGNYIYVGPAEEILRAYEHDAELFVFTTTQVWRVIGGQGQYRAVTTPVNRGLLSRFGVCRGGRGLYLRSFDGIYEYPSGRRISEPISNVFSKEIEDGEIVNEIPPVVEGREAEECMEFYGDKLYFSYVSDELWGNDRTWVWDTTYERWHQYLYGCFNMFAEPETNILIGDELTQYGEIVDGEAGDLASGGAWPLRLEHGYVDYCTDMSYSLDLIRGIPWLVDTKEYNLDLPDQEKQFIDFVLDSEPQGSTITVEIAKDQTESATGTHISQGTVTGTGRALTILPTPPDTGNSQMAFRLSVRLYGLTSESATSQLVIYKLIHRFTIEPPRHKTFVTPWSDYGVATPKFFRELWIDMDTFAVELDSIEIQLDHEIAQTIEATQDPVSPLLYADGRKRFYFALEPDLRGTLGRLKIIPAEGYEVKVYGHSFQVLPEPPVITTFQSVYSDESWSYNKLWKEVVMDVDTINKPINLFFWLDGEVKDQWEWTTDVRKELTHSLPQDLIGKLGRITVNEDFVDECINPNGFRYYKHFYVIDKLPPDVTIADSYVQILNFDRLKVLRRFWITVKNPDEDVKMEIFADGVSRTEKTITANPMSTGFSKRRVDLKSTIKGMLFRIVFTSKAEFEIHADKSEVEAKGLNPEDGYTRLKLAPPQTY